MATCGKADLRKVAVIFETFDIDKDARLNSAELTKLIQQCNPKIRFSVVQLEAMVEEVPYMVETLYTQLMLRLCVLMSGLPLAILV